MSKCRSEVIAAIGIVVPYVPRKVSDVRTRFCRNPGISFHFSDDDDGGSSFVNTNNTTKGQCLLLLHLLSCLIIKSVVERSAI